jgi:hypothetical protein
VCITTRKNFFLEKNEIRSGIKIRITAFLSLPPFPDIRMRTSLFYTYPEKWIERVTVYFYLPLYTNCIWNRAHYERLRTAFPP